MVKRAGFAWGIGRELYTAPFIWVKAQDLKRLQKSQNGRWQCFDRFDVEHIETVAGHIVGLVITSGGKRVFAWGEAGQKAPQPQAALDVQAETLTERVQGLARELAALRGVPESTVMGSLNASKAVQDATDKDAARAAVLMSWVSKARQ